MRGCARHGWERPIEGEGSALALGDYAEGGRVSLEVEADWIEDEVEWSWPVWGERVFVGVGAAGLIHA